MGNKSRSMAKSPAALSVTNTLAADSSEPLEPDLLEAPGSSSSAALQLHPQSSQQDVELKSYENPSKITHGFWLQQYSWLHQDSSPAASPRPHQQPQQASPGKSSCGGGGAPRRLLLRWNNLVRSLAGSTGGSATSEPRTGTSSAPPAREKRRRHWFARPLSSSTSRLSQPSQPLQQLHGHSNQLQQPPAANRLHLSPYKQLRALVSRSPIKQSGARRAAAGSSAQQQESSSPDNHQQQPPATSLFVSQQKQQLQQPQAPARQESRQSTGGLFGGLFASPLFRRTNAQSGRRSKRERRQDKRRQQQQQQQQFHHVDEDDYNHDKRSRAKKIRQSEAALSPNSQQPLDSQQNQHQQQRLNDLDPSQPEVSLTNARETRQLVSQQPFAQQSLAENEQELNSDRKPAASWSARAASSEATPLEKRSSGKRVKMGPRETLGESRAADTTTTTQPTNRLRRQVDVLAEPEETGCAAAAEATPVESPHQQQQPPPAQSVQFALESLSSVTSSVRLPESTCAASVAADSTAAEDQELIERRMLPLIQPLATSSSSLASSSSHSSSSSSTSTSSGSSSVAEDCLVDLSPALADELKSDEALTDAGSSGAAGLQRRTNEFSADHKSASLERPHSQPMQSLQQQQQVVVVVETSSTRQQQPPETALKSQFKKLVKRQQSVDSYRMARELKNKQRRQQEDQKRHQSNEAIQGGGGGRAKAAAQQASGRKFSMRLESQSGAAGKLVSGTAQPLEIRIDAAALISKGSTEIGQPENSRDSGTDKKGGAAIETGAVPKKPAPTPPNTLSLMPSTTGLQPFIVGSFSGCITPTYPTHHLPSPKYVSQANSKKYSNASTISSSLAADYASSGTSYHHRNSGGQQNGLAVSTSAEGPTGILGGSGSNTNNQSDTESSIGGGGSATPSRSAAAAVQALNSASSPLNLRGRLDLQNMETSNANSNNRSAMMSALNADQQQVMLVSQALAAAAREEELAAAAARRAQLAEHIYDNKCGLGEDMKFLASLPELCDITFLVGETREPVCAVKAVLAARSRVFHKILLGANPNARKQPPLPLQQQQQQQQQQHQSAEDRRSSSPRAPDRPLASKSSSPIGRTPSPNNQQAQPPPQQWSVLCDASGYNPPATPIESEAARSGRGSVARSGRDSVSATSQGSQQPLIIGPGQMAAPAKRTKKSSIRDSRLSRMFLRRASDPSMRLNQQLMGIGQGGLANNQGLGSGTSAAGSNANQNYLDKMSSSQMSTTMIIEEFEPDVFRQLIEYIHTGCVLLQARTLLGLLNAADYYGLDQLRKACLRFVSCCITVDTVCSLLSTAERYIQYKCTKSIVQKVLEFVDTHAEEIFKLNAFGLLPEHVVRLILARDGLQADEQTKYNGVYTWCEHYCRSVELANMTDVMGNFLEFIQFHKIPTNVLLSEIYPMRIVPDHIFLSALAIQADPQSFEPPPTRLRRMTLPDSLVYGLYDGELPGGAGGAAGGQRKSSRRRKSSTKRAKANLEQVKSYSGTGNGTGNVGGRVADGESVVAGGSDLFGSHPALARSDLPASVAASRGRKSVGGQSSELPGRLGRLRKGSIAQVSISGVMRLSHKLSIKKRHPNMVGSSTQTTGGKQLKHQASTSAVSSSSSSTQKDPLQIGQQILNAYLVEQQCALQEEAARQAAAAAAAAAQKSALTDESGAANQSTAKQQQQPPKEQPIVKISSTRKSFRDFKHISRKIFMRHSSGNKTLQQQHSTATATASPASFSSQQPPAAKAPTSSTTGAIATTMSTTTPLAATRSLAASTEGGPKERDKSSRRKLLKIKRSETVFETTTGSH